METSKKNINDRLYNMFYVLYMHVKTPPAISMFLVMPIQLDTYPKKQISYPTSEWFIVIVIEAIILFI